MYLLKPEGFISWIVLIVPNRYISQKLVKKFKVYSDQISGIFICQSKTWEFNTKYKNSSHPLYKSILPILKDAILVKVILKL